ncbi:uncharacterized protein LOC132630973 [Lycium barbarum]|uniref:uncharacterized protein LOC132630973 n=1 Tax=Lycium barbarum TaxID=112863 RepID=UPI00293F2F30|nr:uncharacterized protein LOC132630973 [Lycium barbarum]
MGSLACLHIGERPLAREIQSLANSLARFDISEPGRVLACVEVRSSLLEQIRALQFDDPKLCKIRDKVLKGKASESRLDEEGILRIKGRVCVPQTGDLTTLIMEEAHSLSMKHDIVKFVSKCLNCQQVKYGHQKPGGNSQRMPIPECKWDMIAMDFLMTYTSEKLAKIYIHEVLRLHGVPVSIISDRGTQVTSYFWKNLQMELAEFAYNNNYHSSTEMAPFEALYGSRYQSSIRLFDSFERVRDVAYELALPPGLSSFHPVFHVSMFKKWDLVMLDQNLSYEEEPIAILDRQICKFRSKEIASVKVQ